ncbi:MAG: HAD hydrolase family protein, partial [Planctomycetota bacterium]
NLLLAGLIASLVGVALGVAFSLTLTRPLDRLAAAARAIAAKDLSHRVVPGGTIEVANVAEAFNDMAGSLQKAEELRRNLIADVAHELRTPLTVMQGNLAAQLDGLFPIDQTETARLTEPDVVAPLENWLDQDLTKLLLLGQAADLTAIADAVHKKYPHQVRILQTEDNLLQITHATVSKAQALRTVAAEMTVQREQVMAIGDNANDVGMLRWAGIGVAMANACPAALAAADFVTDSHDADGAANAIRRIILEGKIPENVTNAPRHRGRPKVRGE